MEPAISLDTVSAALCQVQVFLRPYLRLANTHGAEFLSDDHWCHYLSPAVQTNLLDLSTDDLVNLSLLTLHENCDENNMSCSDSDKIHNAGEKQSSSGQTDHQVKNLAAFISEAQKCHLDKLDVLTPLAVLLPENPSLVVSEAMSEKKLHEVGIMVDAVSALCKSTKSDLVVDIGSGKGYFASEMSLKHKIPVVGFDSRDTNTHGASQRDRKLAKKWAGLEKRKRLKLEVSTSSNLQPDERQKKIENQNQSIHLPNLNHDVGQESSIPTKPSSSEAPKNKICDIDGSGTSISSINPSCLRETSESQESAHCDKNSQLLSQINTLNCDLYKPVTLYVHPEMELFKVIREEVPEYRNVVSARLFLSGLHTCGSLAVTSLNLFLQDSNTVGLCCVGCCYQLMEERRPDSCESDLHQEQHFPISACGRNLDLQLGRNARNLASQSVHRIRASGQLQGGDFFWRALLNVLLTKLGIPIPERINGMRGLNKRCKTFQDYAAAAFEKLGLADKLADVHTLAANLEAEHQEVRTRMSAFFQLKLVLAPVIEALILLDRLAFLLEQDAVSTGYLVQLFDPVLSPRCYALIAWKQMDKKEKS
ncbi:methyltransferase-like protein 25 [Elysia marginata]|uniref:Methyltransferase-like protein 25 n=1 Tax=Elysia marginata TaxID=1093978 RepID=A0AAV4HJ07_9GAST|nr:methyltransferase-like protein 25 [Elysia marginata]